ncbi:MAG: EAL domain-containing protein, partial [Steroidobacteraceae bacterium]
LRDVTQARAMALRMVHLAHYDALTGLPNRLLLQDRATQAIARGSREGTGFALMYLDLDGFKDINDSLGHMTGDRLLQAAGERLRTVVADLARLGGDEFIALVRNPQAGEALAVSASIAAEIRRPFMIDGRELRVTASIGIASFPEDGADVATLLQHADTAMYHAKAQGRDNAQFYHASLTQQAIERMTLERDLRVALERSQFSVVYQPQFDTRTGRVDSVEALIRWTHPERGAISPADFIPVAERNGLIVPIGEYVLRTACRQAAAWRRAGLSLRVAVNLSPVQLHHPGLGALVTETLHECGLPAANLELEMTETALMDHSEATRSTLRALRDMGVRLALDDFGTGFSSMSYLQRMPLNTLKIDRSFVQHLPGDKDSVTLIRTIVTMARSLGLEVTAEGVETAEQALLLTELRCEQLQGWYIGKPVSGKEVASWRTGRSIGTDDTASMGQVSRKASRA